MNLEMTAGGNKIINRRLLQKVMCATGSTCKDYGLMMNKDIFVGSFNLDPRSSHINTEEVGCMCRVLFWQKELWRI